VNYKAFRNWLIFYQYYQYLNVKCKIKNVKYKSKGRLKSVRLTQDRTGLFQNSNPDRYRDQTPNPIATCLSGRRVGTELV